MPPKIATSRVLRYSSLAIPVVAVTVPISGYLPLFYNTVAGISLTTIGVAFFILRMLDFALDVLIAMSVDSCPWRRGVYRPWMVLSLPVLLAGVWMMYLPDPRWLSLPYVLGSGLLLYAGYSIANITHQAWGAEVFALSGQIEQFFGFRELAVITGILGVALVPAVVESVWHADLPARVQSIGLFLLCGLVLIGPLAIGAIPDARNDRRPHVFSFAGGIMCLRNSSLRGVVLAKIFIFFAIIGSHTMLPFVVKSYFHLFDYFSRLLAIYFVCAFVGVFFWLRMARQLGDLRTLQCAAAYMIVVHLSTVAIAARAGTLTPLALHFGAMGAGFGAIPMLLRSTAGRIAQYFETHMGTSIRGVVFGLVTIAEKLGIAAAAGVALPLMDLFGLQASGYNTTSTLRSLLAAYFVVPVLGYGLTLLAISRIRPEHLSDRFGATPLPSGRRSP